MTEKDEAAQERAERLAARRESYAKKQAGVYVVKPGDSLSKIAKEVYGDADRWEEILEANKDQLKDPDAIQPGQELNIP